MIKIVDYGMGNLRSVQKAFERLGVEAVVCERAADLDGAEKLVVPGVGAFRDAIGELRRREMVGPVCEHIAAGRPFLGICLGLQLLFDVSYEDGEWEGLGIVPGKVVRFEDRAGLKVPHMGWNRVEWDGLAIRPTGEGGRPKLLEGIAPEEAWFYFVHSYYVVPADESVVAARTEHGVRFVSMIARDNLFATQFHPEKSQRTGLKLLSNFAAL
jgi:imidazole glycerol-phosphate synthase subunit HisH